MHRVIDEKDFFREATLKICGSLEIERALYHCLLYIRQFIPAGQMGFHIYHGEAGVVETVAYATPDGGRIMSLKSQLSQKGQLRVEKQRSLRVRVIDRSEDDPVSAPVARRFNASDLSVVVLDLVLEKTMLGVLSVFNNGMEQFSPEHVHLLSLLSKPFAIALTNSLRFRELNNLKELLADDNRYLQEELHKLSGKTVIGAEQGLKSVMQMVHQVSPLDSPVLLLGETGTGKEVIANAIHHLSPRKEGAFIRVNCGAIPASLLDSELFGYEKGAFTGAFSRKRGRIERAQGGTLFLDEIGELSPEAQVRLLRVLQEKEIERVGGGETLRIDIRIIAATHRNLQEMMSRQAFRADLFFRLRVFPIVIPPLRKRKEDLPDLVRHFILKKCAEMKRVKPPSLAGDVMDRLRDYHWPGNIRELENAVERALILDHGGHLYFKEIGALDCTATDEQVMERAEEKEKTKGAYPSLDEVMSHHIQQVLSHCNGRVEGDKGAAKILKVNPSTLRKRMKKLGILFGKHVKQ